MNWGVISASKSREGYHLKQKEPHIKLYAQNEGSRLELCCSAHLIALQHPWGAVFGGFLRILATMTGQQSQCSITCAITDRCLGTQMHVQGYIAGQTLKLCAASDTYHRQLREFHYSPDHNTPKPCHEGCSLPAASYPPLQDAHP